MSEQPSAKVFNDPKNTPRLYPPDWTSIAIRIKDKADWHCQNCHRPNDHRIGYTLTVHHKDHNTFNNSDENLIALCQRCHLIEEGKYRHRLHRDRYLNTLQASGQQILPTFSSLLFPQPNNP